MHAGEVALIRAGLSALLFTVIACPALAQKDAAEKVQEGNVNNWIEYYRQQREAAPSPPSAAAGEKRPGNTGSGAEERREKREEIDPKVQGERPN
jgi:hypothetical protein